MMALLALEMGKFMLVQSMRYSILIGTWDLERIFGGARFDLISDLGERNVMGITFFFFPLQGSSGKHNFGLDSPPSPSQSQSPSHPHPHSPSIV